MVRAGFLRRAAAGAIDVALGGAVCLLFSKTVGLFFARQAFVTLRVGQAGTWWTGPVPLVLGMFGEVVYFLPSVLLLIWTLDLLTGATVGKRLLALRERASDGGRASLVRRCARTAVQTAGLWGWTVALLIGSWQVALLASAAGVVVIAGSLLALGPARLTLHDRVTRTCVAR
jgi:hypothetical protein